MATASTLLPPYTSAILPPGIWGSSLSEGFSGGTHLEDHVACKEHAHYVSSDNAVPHERAVLIVNVLWARGVGRLLPYSFSIPWINRLPLFDVKCSLVDHGGDDQVHVDLAGEELGLR